MTVRGKSIGGTSRNLDRSALFIQQKLIRKINLEAETEDLDAMLAELERTCEGFQFLGSYAEV